MTADEVIDQALARCTDLGATVPITRSVCYTRLTTRESQLFARAAAVHPEYFGVTTTAAIVGGLVNLLNFVPRVERVVEVRVAAGTGLPVGAVVNLVPIDDVDAMLAPRATIRNGQIKGVGTDLAGVTSLTIHYARRGGAAPMTGTTVPELPDQFLDLLVLDLARYMIAKLLDMDAARREGWLGLLTAEEQGLLGTFDEHIRHFIGPEQRRFRGPGAPPPGGDNG